jgi:hypothetical protein
MGWIRKSEIDRIAANVMWLTQGVVLVEMENVKEAENMCILE